MFLDSGIVLERRCYVQINDFIDSNDRRRESKTESWVPGILYVPMATAGHVH